MKTYILSILAMLMAVGCSAAEPAENGGQPEEPSQQAGDQKILIAYFSRTGTTESLAEYIHTGVESDIFEITTFEPYPEDYDQCVAQAREELNSGHRPALSATVDNITNYDVIMVGYPIWISNIPPPIFTFLESYDLTGKTVIPFCTSGTSSAAASYRNIGSLCPGSTVTEGLQISRGTSTADRNSRTDEWLKRAGIITE